MWDPPIGSGTTTSVIYAGASLTIGETYYARVTASDGIDWGWWWETSFTLYEAPLAAFSATPTSGVAPLDVQFNDESAGDITSWEWDFDNDGTVDSTAQSPTHTYTIQGHILYLSR